MTRYFSHFGLYALALSLVVVVVFGPILQNDFVLWDDDINYLRNPDLNPVTLNTFRKAWTSRHFDTYRPLTNCVVALLALPRLPIAREMADIGLSSTLNPRLFHLASLFLHTVNALLVFGLLRLLAKLLMEKHQDTLSAERLNIAAFFGALLWAIHPVQLETVAWATGITDLLKGLFAFAALWQYASFRRATEASQARRNYITATIFFFLGLLSHPAIVIIPVLAALLDRALFARSWPQVIRALALWVLLALPFAGATASTEKLQQDSPKSHNATPVAGYPTPETVEVAPLLRPLVMLDALSFYSGHLLRPVPISVDYGRHPARLFANLTDQPLLLLNCFVPLALVVLFWKLNRLWLGVGLAGWFFLLALLPNSGIIPFRFQYFSTVADRYLYIASFGPALATALFFVAPSSERLRPLILVIKTGVAVFLGVLALQTFSQCRIWQNSETLWRHALEVNPQSFLAHNNLGNILARRDQNTKAMQHYRAAVQINPRYGQALNNLGVALYGIGDLNEAGRVLNEALQVDDDLGLAHYNMANVLADLKRIGEAKTEYRRALQLRPDYAPAHARFAEVLAGQNELVPAISHYREALRLDPAKIRTRFNLGVALARSGDKTQAIAEWTKVVQTQPNFAEAHANLGAHLAQRGNKQAAIKHLETALRLRPDFDNVRQLLKKLRSPLKTPK